MVNLGKASFCDPNVFSSSYLPAIVIYMTSIGFYLQKNACRFINFFLSVFKVLLLNIRKTYSDSDCWETNLRLSPFKGDQHHAYLPNGPRTACNLLKRLF